MFSKVSKPPWLGPYQLKNDWPVFRQYSNTLTQQDHRNKEVADCGTLKLEWHCQSAGIDNNGQICVINEGSNNRRNFSKD